MVLRPTYTVKAQVVVQGLHREANAPCIARSPRLVEGDGGDLLERPAAPAFVEKWLGKSIIACVQGQAEVNRFARPLRDLPLKAAPLSLGKAAGKPCDSVAA